MASLGPQLAPPSISQARITRARPSGAIIGGLGPLHIRRLGLPMRSNSHGTPKTFPGPSHRGGKRERFLHGAARFAYKGTIDPFPDIREVVR